MKIVDIAVKRPVTSTMFFLAAILFGIVSIFGLELQLYPEINFPMVVVSSSMSGATPSEVEDQITTPLYDSLTGIKNVESITTNSSQGDAYLQLEFKDSVDIDKALDEVTKSVNKVSYAMPKNASKPYIGTYDLGDQPIYSFSISGEGILSNKVLVEGEIKSRLERIQGVSSVKISGLQQKSLEVMLDTDGLLKYGLTLEQVSQTLSDTNKDAQAGSMKIGAKTISIKSIGRFKDLNDIKQMSIPTEGGSVLLNDIATMRIKSNSEESLSYTEGYPGIDIAIKKGSTANTVTVAKAIDEELANLRLKYSNYAFTVTDNQATDIQKSINSVVTAALIGAFFAIVILYLFMRNIVSTLIIGVSIPVSILMSFIIIKATGTTLNMVSLAGLTLGVGMLVDNSIVVIENIFRHRKNGDSRVEAAKKGVNEVALAIIASTSTTVAVFLPTIYAKGITASLFKDLSITVMASLAASLLVAITLVPMIASKHLKLNREREVSPLVMKLMERYKAFLRWCLNHRKTVIAATIGLLAVSLGVIVPAVGIELMPQSEATEFNIDIEIPKGEGRERITGIVDDVNLVLEANKDSLGQITYNIYPKDGNANFRVNFAKELAKKEAVINSVKSALTGKHSGVNISVDGSYQSFGNVSQEVSVKLSGKDNDVLQGVKKALADQFLEVKGVVSIKGKEVSGNKELLLHLDQEKIKLLGLSGMDVLQQIRVATNTESQSSTFDYNGDKIDIILKQDKEAIKDIDNLKIKNRSGGTFILGDLGKTEERELPSNIRKVKGVYEDTINLEIKGEQSDIVKRVQEVIGAYQAPSSVKITMGGEAGEINETFKNLGFILIMAVLLVYMVLASQFESLKQPFIIMGTVPLSMIGVVLGHLVFGVKIGTLSLMGMVMLAGMIVNGAIVLIDYVNQLRAKGKELEEAVIEASIIRLRPIMMTALTTILAMLPMAFKIGEGSEMMAPMAVSVVGGLSFGTVLTLVVVPVCYVMADKEKNKKKKEKKVKKNKEEKTDKKTRKNMKAKNNHSRTSEGEVSHDN